MPNPQADKLIQFLIRNGIDDQKVLNAIHRLPRELFVSQAMVHQAYENNALPIGAGADHIAALYRGENDAVAGFTADESGS